MIRPITRRGTLGLFGASALATALPACRTTEALDADVVVMGAGLSGLYAAMLLEDEGLDVIVVEALDRVGGRMFTLDHGDGFTEGGGQQIGASYARVIDTAESLGVPLYAETARGPGTAYWIDGSWSDDGVDIAAFPEPFRNTPPGSVLFRLLASTPGLDAADEWLDADPALDISAAQFLTEQGFSGKAQSLIGHALNGNDLGSYSMLNLHRTWQLYLQSSGMGDTRYVEGGSQRLPEAMAARLSQPVRTGTVVERIVTDADRVTLQTSAGRIHASHAVCTLPYPALSKISGLEGLPTIQREAIQQLAYTQILQVHMRGLSPFWEEDELSPSMWTDTPLERIFADTGRDGSLTGFHRGWVNGTGVAHWAEYTDTANRYTQSLAELRPATRNALEPLATVDWTTSNPFAGGAYYHWQPGQAARFAHDMGRAFGRLHFAGEHLGRLHTGMEAAMESAEVAALQIIEGAG